MNKQWLELDMVDKAYKATHQIRQPSWAAHCMAMDINLAEQSAKVDACKNYPTIKTRTPAYDFRPTPLAVVVPQLPPVMELSDSDFDLDEPDEL
jgi:hypothetical protein